MKCYNSSIMVIFPWSGIAMLESFMPPIHYLNVTSGTLAHYKLFCLLTYLHVVTYWQ